MKSRRPIFIATLASAICAFAAGGDVDREAASAVPTVPDSAKIVTAGADTSFRYTHDNVLSFVSFVLTHHALRNSETLHNWPFVAFAAPAMSSSLRWTKDFGKALSIKGNTAGSLTPINVGITAGLDLELIHLFEIGIQGTASSAWNYGRTGTFMGVYNPEKRTFGQDMFMTEGAFGVIYKASLTVPLLAILPRSQWTRIILKAAGNLENSFYTGADDGEPWRAGADTRVNGYRGDISGSLIYMLPFKSIPMAMITVKTGAFLNEGDFDEVYRDYDPDFRTTSVTPMLTFRLNKKWGGMVMAPIVRERKYNKSKYESNEELMLKRVGKEWRMNVVMGVLNYKF